MSRMANSGGITAGEWQMIQDCISRCAWSLDRGDSRGLADCFTPSGSIVLTDGKRFTGAAELRAFAAEAGRTPNFRGRQHHVRPLFVEHGPDGPVCTSYYQVVRSDVGKAPAIVSLGYYTDRFASHDGRLLLAERKLHRWNSERAPRGRSVAPRKLSRIVPGGPTAPGAPSPADRAAMEALMMEYAVALDTGDVARMTAAFEPKGELISSSLGSLMAPEGLVRFLARNTSEPGFGGRQHRISPLVFEPHELGWRAFSYWKVETWAVGSPPTVLALGYYEDVFSKRTGSWKTVSKAIRRWNNEAAPMAPGWPEAAQ